MLEKYGKKLLVEAIGTAMLTLIACGVAVAYGSSITVSLAFGLVITLLCYTIGPVSGGHFNPAVSVAKLINKEISGEECILYVFAQIIGAIVGSLVLGLITAQFANLGANGIRFDNENSDALNYISASLVELVLTFIFVFVVLFATGKNSKTVNASGLVVGAALTLVHLFGFYITGTSVNPARSIAPALVQMLSNSLESAKVLPVFIFGPLLGGVLAAITYRYINAEEKKQYGIVKYIFVLVLTLFAGVVLVAFTSTVMTLESYEVGNLALSGLDVTFGNKINGIKIYTFSIGNTISFGVLILTILFLLIASIAGFRKNNALAKKLLLASGIFALISGVLIILTPTFATFSKNLDGISDYSEALTTTGKYAYILMFIVSVLSFVIFATIKKENNNNAETVAKAKEVENNSVDNVQKEESTEGVAAIDADDDNDDSEENQQLEEDNAD